MRPLLAANVIYVICLSIPEVALPISGVVISVSYLGFPGSVELPHRRAVQAIVGVSVLSTLGELTYAGSSTALAAATAPENVPGRALARFQLSTGFSLAIAPAAITALAPRPAALWVSHRRHPPRRRRGRPSEGAALGR
jgi:hypothetical protein